MASQNELLSKAEDVADKVRKFVVDYICFKNREFVVDELRLTLKNI